MIIILRKNIFYSFQNSFKFRYTYQQAFRNFLKETDDYAGQREVIAEETKDQVLTDMQNVASHSKNERKKVK